MAISQQAFMQRCIQLAQLGLGSVAPNPMVGCVIVHNDKIIGEGFHEQYGQPHAEVNAINNVIDDSLLKHSTLYVSLEPCAHFGKTPPCADLIISKNIPRVVIGSRDPFVEVNGRGIEKLRAAGIEVIENICKVECRELNKRFFAFHIKKRPYIILKWAQSADGFIAPEISEEQKIHWISNKQSRLLVHKWRTEEQAIMIGTNTARQDNPQLTARDWEGKNPLRIVLDKELKLDNKLNIFSDEAPTLIFNNKISKQENSNSYIQIDYDKNVLQQVLNHLYELKIQSLIVEGGAQLLQSFINENLHDEIRIFNSDKNLSAGISAPVFSLKNLQHPEKTKLGTDLLLTYQTSEK